MNLVKEFLKILMSILLVAYMIGRFDVPFCASAPDKIVNAQAYLAYHLKGLRHNLAVQKAYIADRYLYVTQRFGSTVYLSRLLLHDDEATYVDEMTISRAGHGQSLDMYTYNGTEYFYFSSKSDPSTSNFWSLQVARVQYSPGAVMNYTDLPRFTYMNYANKTGTRLGETYRVDGGGNHACTIFRVQTREGNVTWSIYDTVAINKLLDSNKQVRMDSAAALNACIASFTQHGSAIVRPNDSFQGVDMLENSEIYTSGGAEGEWPQIAKMSMTGAYRSLVSITNVGAHEIEGVQTDHGNVYFTIVTDPKHKRNSQKVYYVPDHVFH